MRAPRSWLQEFVPELDASPSEIADAFDNLGFEVEALDAPGLGIEGVVAARILEVSAHPNADKLRLADVDFGTGTTRVVCGAPNIAAGMVVPFAPSGATLPGGLTLSRKKIRGVVSDGMLCSARELGLGDDHDGILVLDEASEPGTDVRDALGLNDVVFDLAITPNRPDAMSIIGLARELAAHFSLGFTPPSVAPSPSGDYARVATVEIDDTDRCPRYLARVARVSLGPSPDWLRQRLSLAGVRSISNVVDVTNYVLLERGQPLHAFDLDRLAGPGIVVRRAQDAERMTTLDGVERTLSAEDLLICDADRVPQAIAGIMGGSRAEVSDATTEILLESAYFAPMGISRSSKRLGLRSESSARFERGVDPNGVDVAAARALELLYAMADANIGSDAIDIYPHPVEPVRILLRTGRVNSLLGTTLEPDDVAGALRPLAVTVEAEPSSPATFAATAPTFRPDLTREADLIEEVARRIGLNAIERTLPSTTGHPGALTRRQRERRRVADVFVGFGAYEANTLSLLDPADAAGFGFAPEDCVRAANPLRAEESLLRPRLLPGLLRAAAFNVAHGRRDVTLFELGHIFLPPRAGEELPDERDHVAIVMTGSLRRTPVEVDRPVDCFDVIDYAQALVTEFELVDVRFVAGEPAGFHPARAAELLVDGVVVGHVGEIDPAVVRHYGLTGGVVGAEIAIDDLLAGTRRDRHFVALSRFPDSSIDLAFILDEKLPAASVAAAIRAAVGSELESVECFDAYSDDSLGAHRRSLAFNLRFRAADRTLTDAEVAAHRSRAIDAITSAFPGSELRG